MKYSNGREVESRFGDEKQVMLSLVDGRVAYVSLGVAHSITNLQLGTRESFFICKRWNGAKTQAPRYDVYLTPQGEKDRAAIYGAPDPAPVAAQNPPSDLERQLDASLAAIQERKRDANLIARRPPVAVPEPQLGPVAVPRPTTKLEEALKTVVAAVFAAQEYAKLIGYAAMPQFNSEDIRAMANTLIIDTQRNGGRL